MKFSNLEKLNSSIMRVAKNMLLYSGVICVLGSCSNESLEQPEEVQETNQIPKKFDRLLSELGVNKSDVRFIPSLDLIAYGDILYHPDTEIALESDKKTHWANLGVTWENSRDIRYTVTNFGNAAGANNPAWVAMVDQAAAEWAARSTNIGFTRVANNADNIDLTIEFRLPVDYALIADANISGAFATFPRNMNVGANMYLRENNFSDIVNVSSQMILLMHEFGHILGFTHANQSFAGGVDIPCAGSEQWHQNNPGASIMNSNINFGNWPSATSFNARLTLAQWDAEPTGWTLSDNITLDWAYELIGDNDPVCN